MTREQIVDQLINHTKGAEVYSSAEVAELTGQNAFRQYTETKWHLGILHVDALPGKLLSDEDIENETWNEASIESNKKILFGDAVPPIAVVINSKDEVLLADGSHRVAAARIIGRQTLPGFFTRDAKITGETQESSPPENTEVKRYPSHSIRN